MTYYHKKREEAQAIADQLPLTDKRIAYAKVELVPGNGWVVVLCPAYYDLREYGHQCEVRDKDGRRITPRPPEHRGGAAFGVEAAQRQAARSAPVAQVVVPVTPLTASVKAPWEL